jgi:localization factor PodJL
MGSLGSHGSALSGESPMDQQSVESLLRRLVERVEAGERRYSEALDELHARLDRLTQTTDDARLPGAPEDAETFDRLHDQVSSLARRLEREATTPLDDFERLGWALSGELDYAAGMMGKPDLLSELAASSIQPGQPPFRKSAPYNFQTDYSAPLHAASFPGEDRNLDKRLVEMAHRLEHSISTAMPAQALEALSARLDEIGSQIAQGFDQVPGGPAFETVERQISELAQQLGRAETQLAKIGEIDTALRQLIERVDGSAGDLEEVANKAADAAARRVAEEAKLSAGTVERLDAMHRDLMAMNDRTRAGDDRLSGTIEAVHESLKKLVQLVEQGAPGAQPPKPKLPFADRMRELAPLPGAGAQPLVKAQAEKSEAADTGAPAGPAAKDAPLGNRLRDAIADLDEGGMAPNFGRARRGPPGTRAVDLDTPERTPERTKIEDASFEAPDDLVAAARRAAQAAALKAEERGSRVRARRLPGDREAARSGELPSRRKRSFLIISAAVLLAISAMLLYSRLSSKPDPEVVPSAVEQSAPLPSAPTEGSSAAGADEEAPAAAEPKVETAPAGASELQPETEAGRGGDAVGEASQTGNFTDVAKSYRPAAANEMMPQAQPAALKTTEAHSLPSGVVFVIEDPTLGPQTAAATPSPSPIPQSLPLPPSDLGPLALRQAAAEGDARAQHAIAARYAQGQDTPQNLTEAARWLERAAGAGLAPAQYLLGAMYERGQGVAKDLGRARSWYQAAAEKGNVKAMHNLAVNLSGRESGTADYALAAKWYEEAAAHGLADSQFNLGILAEHGLGIPKSLPDAYKWFALAGAGGDAEAAKRSALIKLKLDAASLAQAEQAVAAWTAKSASPEANEVPEREEWAEASSASSASLLTRAQTLLNQLG